MNCKHCGALLADDAAVCGKCGYSPDGSPMPLNHVVLSAKGRVRRVYLNGKPDGRSIRCFIFGILAFLLAVAMIGLVFMGFSGYIPMLCMGLAGIVLGILAITTSSCRSDMSKLGRVFRIIGRVHGIASLPLCGFLFMLVFNSL